MTDNLGVPICIAGMHRSGTSLVAKLLHECGVYLGREENLVPPAADNPDGFWEHAGFVEINNEILNRLGGAHDCPPPVAVNWEESGIPSVMEKTHFLLDEFCERGVWGWKDPRNSLTLPFWRTVLPGLKLVICLRNPLEVALSLHRRSQFSYALGLTLWYVYNHRLLSYAGDLGYVVTHYDAYFHDPLAELKRLLESLGIPTDEARINRASTCIKRGMRHNQLHTRHLFDADVASDVHELYVHLCEKAHWPSAATADDGQPDGQGRVFRPPDPPPRSPSNEAPMLACGTRDDVPAVSQPVNRPSIDWMLGVGRCDTSYLEAAFLREDRRELTRKLGVRDAEIRELRGQLRNEEAARRTPPTRAADVH